MLEKFGLNNYENKVYLSLMTEASSDARTISQSSDVPYGRIYDVLDSLNSKGLVNEIAGRPKKYTAVEPDAAISSLIEQRKKEVEELEKQAAITKQELNKLYTKKPRDELVWKAAIGDDLFKTYYNLLGEARFEFLAFFELTPEEVNNSKHFKKYLNLLSQLHQQNGIAKIILSLNDPRYFKKVIESHPEFLQILNLAEVKYIKTYHQGFTIIDKEKVIIKVSNPLGDEMLAAMYMWQNTLAQTLRESFLELWEQASPLSIGLNSELNTEN